MVIVLNIRTFYLHFSSAIKCTVSNAIGERKQQQQQPNQWPCTWCWRNQGLMLLVLTFQSVRWRLPFLRIGFYLCREVSHLKNKRSISFNQNPDSDQILECLSIHRMWNICTVPCVPSELSVTWNFIRSKVHPSPKSKSDMGYRCPHNLTVSSDLLCMTIDNFMAHLMNFFVAFALHIALIFCSTFFHITVHTAFSILRSFVFVVPFSMLSFEFYTLTILTECSGFWFSFRFCSFVHLIK